LVCLAQERTRRLRARRGVTGERLTRADWRHLAGLYGVVVSLHLCGGGLLFYYGLHHPTLIGLGFAAYMLGLRHAFDADHIAAVDDTVRYLLQKGQKPFGVGLFFSLGHSTVVLVVAIALIVTAATLKHALPDLRSLGGFIGAGVSGLFLWIIGILNTLVLLDILKLWRHAKAGAHSHAQLDQLLSQRGLINRLFGGRLQRILTASWQMYPLGILFGFGFDTASEVALLGITAGASAGDLPLMAAVSLPLLFAAGMSLMDTTDGVLMVRAYRWAWVNPLRKLFYNLTTTGLSVAVALLMGTIEVLQVIIGALNLNGPIAARIAGLDMTAMGYLIVAMFLGFWGLSVVVWKSGFDQSRAEVHH
jgi:high-affinity nickel-transport protein